jgi:hypothetical protein
MIVYEPLSARKPRKTLLLLLLISAAITAGLAAFGKVMPLHGNTLTKGGIGDSEMIIEAPSIVWEAATFISIYGGILFVIGFLQNSKKLFLLLPSGVDSEVRYILVFGLVLTITGFAPLCLLHLGSHGFYDRYLIFFIPWIMLSMFGTNCKLSGLLVGSGRVVIAVIALLSITIFSIASTHDYLATNRVLWSALNELMRDVDPEEIDGGVEFNGWYLYNDVYAPKPGKSWYWVAVDEYSVSTFLRKGYAPLKNFPVKRWLSWGHAEIVVQRRIGATGPISSP